MHNLHRLPKREPWSESRHQRIKLSHGSHHHLNKCCTVLRPGPWGCSLIYGETSIVRRTWREKESEGISLSGLRKQVRYWGSVLDALIFLMQRPIQEVCSCLVMRSAGWGVSRDRTCRVGSRDDRELFNVDSDDNSSTDIFFFQAILALPN